MKRCVWATVAVLLGCCVLAVAVCVAQRPVGQINWQEGYYAAFTEEMRRYAQNSYVMVVARVGQHHPMQPDGWGQTAQDYTTLYVEEFLWGGAGRGQLRHSAMRMYRAPDGMLQPGDRICVLLQEINNEDGRRYRWGNATWQIDPQGRLTYIRQGSLLKEKDPMPHTLVQMRQAAQLCQEAYARRDKPYRVHGRTLAEVVENSNVVLHVRIQEPEQPLLYCGTDIPDGWGYLPYQVLAVYKGSKSMVNQPVQFVMAPVAGVEMGKEYLFLLQGVEGNFTPAAYHNSIIPMEHTWRVKRVLRLLEEE